jgi:hypothetical protein
MKYVVQWSKKHIQNRYIKTVRAVLQDVNDWLSKHSSARSGEAEVRYVELCKHLNQLIAIDSAEARTDFKYATTTDTPLLIDKLRDVYSSDTDKDFLTDVMNTDTTTDHDNDADDDNSTVSVSQQRKRKHADVSSSSSTNNSAARNSSINNDDNMAT